MSASLSSASGHTNRTAAARAAGESVGPEAAKEGHPSRHPAEQALPLAVVGCDFRVASTQWRGQLLLDGAERDRMTEELRASCGAAGLVVLETCNRVEWLVTAPAAEWAGEVMRAQMVERWLAAQPGLRRKKKHTPTPYVYTGRAAVAHLLRVAVGLESFVVGEREIAGQLNRALAAARVAGQASPFHNALQTAVGRTVKKVQRVTTWRHHSRGVHSLALEAVQNHLRQLNRPADYRPQVVALGMGEIGRKAAGLLAAHGNCQVTRVNRTVPAEREREWQPLSRLPALLAHADALVVATGARVPVVDMAKILPLRAQGAAPLLIVDLGAPAQVASTELPGAMYMDLDSLLSLPAVSPAEDETRHVLELVEDGVREFVLECRKRDLAVLLRSVHDIYDRTSYRDLPERMAAEFPGPDTAEVRKRAESVMRDLLRDMTRDLVQHIESAADARPRGKTAH